MGAFFANIHVYAPTLKTGAGLAAIKTSLIAALTAGPFALAPPGVSPDRSVLIVSDSAPGWFVVVDQDYDEEPSGTRSLPAELSRAPFKATIAMVGNDSDTVDLILSQRGRATARLHVDVAERRSANIFDSSPWNQILSTEQIRQADKALQENAAFAEDRLEGLIHALGWSRDLAFADFEHKDELKGHKMIRLDFVLKPDANFLRFRSGPPRFTPESEEKTLRLKARHPLDWFFATIYNEGGESKGIEVSIPWDRQIAELLHFDGVHVAVGDGSEEDSGFHEETRNGKSRLVAQLPATHLAPYAYWDGPESSFNIRRFNQIFQRSRLWPTLRGLALRQGEAQVDVYYSPRANPVDGAFRIRYHVAVED